MVPKDDVTDDQRDTRLTQEEEKILKRAHDISERKREESKRLTEQWTEQDNKLKRKKEQRGTRERQMREVSNPEELKGRSKVEKNTKGQR